MDKEIKERLPMKPYIIKNRESLIDITGVVVDGQYIRCPNCSGEVETPDHNKHTKCEWCKLYIERQHDELVCIKSVWVDDEEDDDDDRW